MLIRKCDRCNRDIEYSIYFRLSIINENPLLNTNKGSYELCDSCLDDVVNYLSKNPFADSQKINKGAEPNAAETISK